VRLYYTHNKKKNNNATHRFDQLYWGWTARVPVGSGYYIHKNDSYLRIILENRDLTQLKNCAIILG